MTTLDWARLIIGLLATAVVLLFAARRVQFLYQLIRSGQPVGDESGRKDDIPPARIKAQFTEVFGQKKLLKWSIPGLAHFFTMWGFFILATVYLEAYGVLFNPPEFHIPLVGRWNALGFLQDFFAAAVLLGIIVFTIIRLRSEPKEYGRSSRFYGSHTGGAWLILFMIFLVILTFAFFRGASVNALGEAFPPYGWGAFFSHGMAALLAPLGTTANVWIETISLLAHIGVMLAFLLIVLHSKHLHIGLARSTSRSSACPTASARCCPSSTRASRSTSRIPPKMPCSVAARSRTSPGRATSTSPPVPSVVAASRSARPGTPESRCRPSS